MEIFLFQYKDNPVYRRFADLTGRTPGNVASIYEIPFLPVEAFKREMVVSGSAEWQRVFFSSGMELSRHYIVSEAVYRQSYSTWFRQFFGNSGKYCILGLLPSYLERGNSSLVYMVSGLISESVDPDSGFFLYDHEGLMEIIRNKQEEGIPVILFGVTFALLDLAERFSIDFPSLIIIETGGMKGRRKEMIRDELHAILRKSFGTERIYSEYGMTELLSQAYSMGDGIFTGPSWMKVLIRDVHDPFTFLPEGRTGVINVIDLANVFSCSFIATQDIGRISSGKGFEVLGRTDASDLRGCSLMIS